MTSDFDPLTVATDISRCYLAFHMKTCSCVRVLVTTNKVAVSNSPEVTKRARSLKQSQAHLKRQQSGNKGGASASLRKSARLGFDLILCPSGQLNTHLDELISNKQLGTFSAAAE